MATPEQIRQGFEQLAKSHAPAVSNIARVKSVDESTATCTLIDEDDQEFLEVRLKPVLSGNTSFLQIPKVESYVLAVRIEDDEDWMVIASDQVEKFLWTTGKSTVEISDKIHLEANGKNLIDLLERLFTIIELGYMTNSGATIELINQAEFTQLKTEFKQLLK